MKQPVVLSIIQHLLGRALLCLVSAFAAGAVVVVAVLATLLAKQSGAAPGLAAHALVYGVPTFLWLFSLALPATLVLLAGKLLPFARTISPLVFSLATVLGSGAGLIGSYKAVNRILPQPLGLGHTEAAALVGLALWAVLLSCMLLGGLLGSLLGSLPLRPATPTPRSSSPSAG